MFSLERVVTMTRYILFEKSFQNCQQLFLIQFYTQIVVMTIFSLLKSSYSSYSVAMLCQLEMPKGNVLIT